MTAVSPENALVRALSRDRLIIVSSLVGLTAFSWLYLIHDVVSGTRDLPACCMRPDARFWGVSDLTALFVMWSVIMFGLMTPTAAPMVLMFAAINRRRREQERPYVPTALFLLGYLVTWTAFSALATAAQYGLHRAAMISPAMIATNRWLGAILLIAAGIFQFTPAKNRCLSHCRSPLDFIMTDWRDGRRGAFLMGLRHGAFCTGCCWLLMALLFVVGVMNLFWVAVITAFVLAEKALPKGQWLARVSGLFLVGWGLFTLR
jgi:predicted metal-binding membrane protein